MIMIDRIRKVMPVGGFVDALRQVRVHFLLSKVRTWPGMKILHVGCGPDGRSLENHVSPDHLITGIGDIMPGSVTVRHPNFTYYMRDARDLSIFQDKSFDLAISISWLEHVRDRATLDQIAAEMMRVSRQWAVMVPWQYCWIEPHFKLPLFQLMPGWMQTRIVEWLNLQGLRATVSRDPRWIRKHYQWLKTSEWKEIFATDETDVFLGVELLVLKTLNALNLTTH